MLKSKYSKEAELFYHIDLPLLSLTKKEAKECPFKVGDDVVISSSDIFFEGLRGQCAIVVAIGRCEFKCARVIAKNHKVPNYSADFEWEIVLELLEKV